MRILKAMTPALFLVVAACGPGESTGSGSKAVAAGQASARERGGTITVGEESWVIVPSVQCSVWPNGVVSIAGHAATDPALEIVIDHGGPNQVRIGNDGDGDDNWHAVPGTIEIKIEGKHVRGTATFSRYFGGSGESRQGSFDVQC